MQPIIETILDGLRDPNRITEEDYEVLLLAGEALAKFSMRNYHTAGLCPEVDACEISALDSKRIVDALLECYRTTSSDNTRSGILHALGKARDPALEDFFRQQLTEFTKLLLLANRATFQALIGLSKLDESILESGGSLTEVEANLSAAQRYLAQHGTILPW